MSDNLQVKALDEVVTGGLRPITDDTSWLIEQEGFDASREAAMETIFAVGNGYLCVRGVLVDPLPGSQADMFLAGIFAPKLVGFPYSEVELKTKERARGLFVELVPFPFPFHLSLTVAGTAIDLHKVDLINFERILDLRRGAVHQSFRFRDKNGLETGLRTVCCASLSDLHLLLQEVEVVAENHQEPIAVDWSLVGKNLALNHQHLRQLPVQPDTAFSELECFQTIGSNYVTAIGARVWSDNTEIRGTSAVFTALARKPCRLRKMVGIFTSRDTQEPQAETHAYLAGKDWADFDLFWTEHEAAWSRFWNIGDIVFLGAPDLSQAQRFNSYQLRIAADHDDRVSVGARGLTGRAYEGHAFWDTEIFALPFYLYTQPDIARHLLMYRYLTLDGARRRANTMGFQGACYAWESSVTGDDVTPRCIVIEGCETVIPVLTGEQQIHVTADVAYAVVEYWKATRDNAFLLNYGAEILFETARFWSSRVVERQGLFHIDEVIGPDEFHIGVNDDAFTNWMARENLREALAVFAFLEQDAPQKLAALTMRLGLFREQVKRWREVAERLYFPEPNEEGVIEQFEGFFNLPAIVALNDSVERLAGTAALFDWRAINATRVCKQADVLMIPFLFPHALPERIVRASFNYYTPITSHGSSLSRPVHAAVAAQAGYTKESRKFWRDSLFIDLLNLMGNTGLGFHVASAGGTWQALVFHMLGIEKRDDRLLLDARAPRVMPERSPCVHLTLHFGGAEHAFDICAAKDHSS